MVEDARFEDADESPLALRAFDGDDLQVISALAQDAVFSLGDLNWDKRRRQVALLINRYRWENKGKGAERVRSVLAIEDVQSVQSQGFSRGDGELVLSLLALDYRPGEDGTGAVELVLAGDGGIRIAVEALEVTLRDVTRPYRAPTGKMPSHDQ